MVLASCCENNLLYKADPDLDPDLQKKQTLYQNSLYEFKT